MDNLTDDIRENLQQEMTTKELQDIESALHREYVRRPDVPAEWVKMSEVISADEVSAEEADDTMMESLGTDRQTKMRYLWSFLAGVAATAAVFLVFNIYNPKQGGGQEFVFNANQNNTEVLLSDGSDQLEVVSDKQLDYKQQAPAKASSQSAASKLLSVTTPRGKDYHLTLSDGTQVWMNADSKLEFPKQFAGLQRKVKLQGEAYFEVAKDAKHPFVVETEYFNTTVLGTTFNIKAYSAKDANIVLIEGSVKVQAGKHMQQLRPGQQASVGSHNASFIVREVDTYPFTQWREGFFYFENETLFEIMQELGRWYNVNIAFEDNQKMNLRLHFVCNRSQALSEAIKNMNELGVVDVELTSDAVIIK